MATVVGTPTSSSATGSLPGMVALPLLALMARHVTGSALAAFAPLPLVAYLTMLMREDKYSAFTMVSYIAGLLTYAGLLAFILRSSPPLP